MRHVAITRRNKKQHVPSGQPKPFPRTRMHKNGKGKDVPEFVYPHEVVRVHSKEDLTDQLDHYSHPVPMMDGSPHPKNKHAMRWQMEWIRPALRWFCKVYDHEMPEWLHGNGWAEEMSDDDYKKFFGGAPLQVKEWHENKTLGGERA